MSTWIKLCGLSTQADVDTAIDCDVQAVGFVFAKSVRCIAPEHAAGLTQRLPPGMVSVAVMLRPTQSELDEVLGGFLPDCVQADWQALRDLILPDTVTALPVYRQGDGIEPVNTPTRFVYEGASSGQGKKVDWPDVRPFIRKRELILAGGLNPGNVSDAIHMLAPFGVDVSSGIERERGVKDQQRMRDFVAQVRACESRAET